MLKAFNHRGQGTIPTITPIMKDGRIIQILAMQTIGLLHSSTINNVHLASQIFGFPNLKPSQQYQPQQPPQGNSLEDMVLSLANHSAKF